MNYFLDFGTHYFQGTIHENGILAFERRGFFGTEQPYRWHVLTFEPSPHAFEANKKFLPSIASRFFLLEAYQAAVGSSNGTIEFKWCPGNEAGSNCLGMPVREVSEIGAEVYEVKVVDVKELVEDIIQKDPQASIFVKCDTEGAEFFILPRLLEAKGAEQCVKEVFVEWHERFWADKPDYQEILDQKAMIKKQCQEAGIILHDWQ